MQQKEKSKKDRLRGTFEDSRQKRVQKKVDPLLKEGSMKTDPLGSWTGLPRDRNDEPTQDADDL